MDSLLQDLRIGFRVLMKERAFCALAVGVLALGIGAVATQFAVVNGVILRGFDFPDADRLVDVQMVDPVDFKPGDFNARVTTSDFVELRDQQTSFSTFTAYLNGSTINLTYQGQPERLQGGYVTHDFFRALGVAPVLGRDFLPEEDQAGVNKAVLISDSLWHARFEGSPDVIGRSVRINGRAGTIIGVMPPKFNFPLNEQLWVPLNTEFPVRARNDRNINTVQIIARLKPGVTIEQAQAEISTLARQFAEAYPDTNARFTQGYVRPLIQVFLDGGQVVGILYTLLGFCVGVLLIACFNVMNMQFARAALRAKELAVRSSLGATRSRLIRQMLTESFVIASFGAIIGVALALWATDFLDTSIHMSPNPPPSWMRFTLDGRVVVFVVLATGASALLAGFIPAWLSSRANSLDVLKEGGRGNTSRTVNLLTRGLVVLQIVVTSVLLVGALLQVQSVTRQQNINYGYDTSSVLAARLGLMEGDYPDVASRRLFYERLLRELRAGGQFEGAALTNRMRMVFSGRTWIEVEGRSYLSDSDRTQAELEGVSPGYFDTLNVRLLEGRDFTELDTDQREPVAIVNARFARKHFGAESPLGRRFRTALQDGTNAGPWRQIVGVVSDVRMQNPFNSESDGSGFYVPFFSPAFGPLATEPVAPQFGTIVIRPRPGQRPEALGPTLQAAVNRVDPNLPLYFVATPEQAIAGQLTQVRIIASMFGMFGAIAVILAAVGLYGVMSFSVAQRTQEFGVRMALGADAQRILRMVLRQAGLQLAIGLGLGFSFALVVGTLGREGIEDFLFEIGPLDAKTYLFVGLILTLVSFFASLFPARRATKVDPMVALRSE
jgi:putative ABC transport system permease protein